MNVWKREWKANRKALFFWCLGLILFIAVGMMKYKGIAQESAAMNEMMGQMPRIVKVIFGMGNNDMSTPDGFYSILYTYLLIMGGIYAGMLGANIIAKEERDKTSDFLFVKPISRSRVITEKLLVVLLNITILTALCSVLSTAIVRHYAGNAVLPKMLSVSIGLFLFQLIFAAFGAGMAAVFRKSHKAAGFVAAVLMGGYFISVLTDMLEGGKVITYFTPFKYVSAEDLLFGNGFQIGYLAVSFLIIFSMMALLYRMYPKRDLH